jgi:hypothetical protein
LYKSEKKAVFRMGGRTLKALIPIRKRKSCWIFYTAIDMKTDLIFFIAIFVIAVLFIGHFRLTFSPFSISLPYWHRALGVVLIVVGCLIYNIGEHMSGYKKGLDNGMEIVLKQLKKRYERPGD